MNRKRLLTLQLGGIFIGFLGGLSYASQQVASALDYHELLGPPLFQQGDSSIYLPWSWLIWANQHWEEVPELFSDTMTTVGLGAIFGILWAAALKKRFAQKEEPNYHGSSRWARPDELAALDLLQKPKEARGVVIGREPDGSRLITHQGKEHVFVFAPTRSGKGVGLVIPSLLTWRGSVFVLDIKGENWALTAGWRAQFSHAIYLDPTSPKSARFNPLLEVRKGEAEVRDVRNIVDILGNPDGEAKNDFWSLSAKNFLVGAILHVLYAEKDKSLAGVLAFLRNPEWDHEERLERMLNAQHLPTGPHPVVARAAKSLLNSPENTRGGILSTVESFLGLFDDPIVAKVTSGVSDFRLRDMQYAKNPVSLYLVVPPSDLLRVRPLLRLLLVQLGGALTEELHADENKHRLLLLLDEFPTLGRLDWFESALAYIAGYEIKAYLIAQDLNQIEKAYGSNNAILGNCHVRIAYAPNDERTAKRLSEMLGKRTGVKEGTSFSGKRGGFGLENMSRSTTEYARDLLTPGEILQLSPDKQLLFIAGQPPILADKVRYYTDPHFQQRSPGIGNPKGGKWNARFAPPRLTGTGAYPDKPKQEPNSWFAAKPSAPAEPLEPIEVAPAEIIPAPVEATPAEVPLVEMTPAPVEVFPDDQVEVAPFEVTPAPEVASFHTPIDSFEPPSPGTPTPTDFEDLPSAERAPVPVVVAPETTVPEAEDDADNNEESPLDDEWLI